MKKFSLLVECVCLLAALAGCGVQYEDTNGSERFSLQTITDRNMIHLETGASGLSYTETKLGGFSRSEYSAKNFNGVERIYLTNFLLPSDVEVYIGHMDVKKGNFRLVAVNNDEIIHEFPLDAFGDTFRFENLTGSFAIHVAGESAAFSFHLDVQ